MKTTFNLTPPQKTLFKKINKKVLNFSIDEGIKFSVDQYPKGTIIEILPFYDELTVTVEIYELCEVDNPNYEKELKIYKKKLEKFEQRSEELYKKEKDKELKKKKIQEKRKKALYEKLKKKFEKGIEEGKIEVKWNNTKYKPNTENILKDNSLTEEFKKIIKNE